MQIKVTPEELRYIIRCGAALAQNVPEKSLPTYCGFDKQQIVDFSGRMRSELDKAGLDM
ncbi:MULTISPECIES: hypothetical protein [unclassified Bradyrhizobium]|uniref:hypothetical protein n=1 Tax=unclassified Bradyrhizobium TaxID=2631580 RepID=UPI0012EC73FD|nr:MULTISPECIES: hypothetical protein [unclassified Bradyrhizobium]QIG92722.1 hypothetical protein G6P99_09550 [Bradyrhizobium sp. 6(2017)]